MAYPSPEQERAFRSMQERLVWLIQLHDRERYQKLITERTDRAADTEFDATLRSLMVLLALYQELFDDILPRIVRRLSFAAPRELRVEQAPPRGQIDWPRTLDRLWDELPDQPPLEVVTRTQRRDFARPENVLTVLALLEYAALVREALARHDTAQALEHPLNEAIERIERALAFPQFAGLRGAAQAILEERHPDYADGLELAAHAAADLPPGGNSAYADLIDWYERLKELAVLLQSLGASRTLGADPDRDHYVFQLWIFYELFDLIRTGIDGQATISRKERGDATIRFGWQDGAYEIAHERTGKVLWQSSAGAAPGVRPDFTLRQQGGAPYAQVLWDAKYYVPAAEAQDAPANGAPGPVPSGPIKRMLADLQLLGLRRGELLFAFHDGGDTAGAAVTPSADAIQPLIPEPLPAVTEPWQAGPALEIRASALRPDAAIDHQARLREILERGLGWLATLPQPRCYGVFLDSSHVDDQAALLRAFSLDKDGEAAPLSELLVCPKPHLGPGRVEIVSRARHCLKDPLRCHIVDLEEVRLPQRPPRTTEDLLKELQALFDPQAEHDEERAAAVAQEIERLSKRFAKLNNVNLATYFQRVRDLGIAETFDQLPSDDKESLALAIFIADRIDEIKAQDYSAPTIHISSVLERVLKKTIFRAPGLSDKLSNPSSQTLGALTFLHSNQHSLYKSYDKQNWQAFQRYAAAHLKPFVFEEEELPFSFDLFLRELDVVRDQRNRAAHSGSVTSQNYRKIQKLVLQYSRLLGPGILTAYLLSWR